jgi:hypothetical protein
MKNIDDQFEILREILEKVEKFEWEIIQYDHSISTLTDLEKFQIILEYYYLFDIYVFLVFQDGEVVFRTSSRQNSFNFNFLLERILDTQLEEDSLEEFEEQLKNL